MKANSGKYVTYGIVIVCMLAIIGAVVLYVLRTKEQPSGSDVDSDGSDGSSLEDTALLTYGSRGKKVEDLQSFLNAKLAFYSHERGGRPVYKGNEISSLIVDGIFGAKTQCATKWWFGKDSVQTSEIQ
mgnify:CR=1 FL=1